MGDKRYGNFFHKLLEAVPSPIFYKDAKGRYRGGNTAWASKILGLPLEQIIGRTVFELPTQIPEDLARKYHEADLALMQEKRNQTYEAQVLCADGVLRDFQFHKAVITARNGRTIGIVGVMSDLTEKNRIQRLLAQQTQQYENILADVTVGIYVTDVEGQVIHANESFLRILGYPTLDDLKKVNTKSLYADPQVREELVQKLREVGSVNRIVTLKRSNGELFDVQIFARLQGSQMNGFLSEIDRHRDHLLLVTCAWCNKMRDGDGELGIWLTPAEYLSENKGLIKNPELDYVFTHGVCPDCADSLDEEAPG